MAPMSTMLVADVITCTAAFHGHNSAGVLCETLSQVSQVLVHGTASIAFTFFVLSADAAANLRAVQGHNHRRLIEQPPTFPIDGKHTSPDFQKALGDTSGVQPASLASCGGCAGSSKDGNTKAIVQMGVNDLPISIFSIDGHDILPDFRKALGSAFSVQLASPASHGGVACSSQEDSTNVILNKG